MKILCSGDLHLGRRSSRLPDGVDGRVHSATAAWSALVELAIDERVDLVALSGDVVDRENRYFEAFGPLERGVRRLAAAGIAVVAVAGNHDFDVLPKLAPSLGKSFRLLGAGGRWEGLTIPRDGRPALHLVGWSFPAERVPVSPLAGGLPPLPGDGAPVLGLLHADLDQPGSPYAPVASGELRAAPVWFWLLGHVHAPRLHEEPGAAPLLYPGSPQALDPGETGVHGAWLLELAQDRPPVARHLPLSTVRYDSVEVDVTGVAEWDELDRRVAEGVRAHVQRVAEAGCGPLRHLSARVRVTGRTPLHRFVEARLRERLPELDPEHGAVRGHVERVEAATRPAVELDELARGGDAPGVLARFVLALEGDRLDAGQERLLNDLAARSAEVRRARPYQPLADGQLAPEALRGLARRQALLLIDALLAQKEAA
jgi:DNA repair exonuclease SbcCD nuclease subunit